MAKSDGGDGGGGPSSWTVEPSPDLHAAVAAANAGEPLTLGQVGALFGISRSRVQQLEFRVLRAMRYDLGVDVERDYRDGVLGFRRGRIPSDSPDADPSHRGPLAKAVRAE